LAHGYRTLQHWNQWLTHQFLGTALLEAERQMLSGLLERHYGKHDLLIGVPGQHTLLTANSVACHTLMSPIHHSKETAYVEADFHDLPILTGSIDIVLLPHTLEFVDNPRQLLSEACRIVKPEGLIVIFGFNPYGVWGMRKKIAGSPIRCQHIKNWLKLAEFALEKQSSFLYRPPINKENIYHKLASLERIGSVIYPLLAGAYVVVARAKVIPLTPIRLKWKQDLSNIRISTTIPGNLAR
jgi:SAM-dependent methyltransferase